MTIDLEQIKKNYADFDDFKIERLAKNEADGLAPEVIPILIDEIKKRGLNPDLIKGIESQIKELTESELNELKYKIINLPCPDCGSQSTPLVGSLIRTVKSFIFMTSYAKTPVITCKFCSNKRKKNAIITTLLLGWWGIPYGIFKTPISLLATLRDHKKEEEISDQIITLFALNNMGELKTNWDNEKELVEYVRHINESS